MPSSFHHSATMRHGPAAPTTRPPRPSPRTNTGAPRSLNTSTGRGGRGARAASPPTPPARGRPPGAAGEGGHGTPHATPGRGARATGGGPPRAGAAKQEGGGLGVCGRVPGRRRLLPRGGQRRGGEGPLVDPARRTHGRRARGAERRGDLGGGQAGEIAEPMDAPALERARDL